MVNHLWQEFNTSEYISISNATIASRNALYVITTINQDIFEHLRIQEPMSTQYASLGSPVAQMFHAMAACRTAHHLRRKSGFGMNCQSVKVATYWCGCRLHLQTCTSLIINACTYVHLSFPFRVYFMWPLTNKFRKCKVERGSDGGGKPEWSPTICVDTGTAAVIDGHLLSLSQYCNGNHRRDKRGQGPLCVCVCLPEPKVEPLSQVDKGSFAGWDRRFASIAWHDYY